MHRYRAKTPLANAADHLLRMLLALLAGVGWFVFLWGLSLPALTAGLSLGGLIWLCARLFGKKRVARKEAAMRQMLGGELALEKLLLLAPRRAAFQAALWLAPKAPVQMERTLNWGVLGSLAQKRVLIRLIARHPSMEIDVQQVLEAVKEARQHQAQRCFLLATAPLSKEALRYAADAEPQVRVVPRDELIALAGACSPATDEDLAGLGRKKRARRGAKEWARVVLDKSRAKRYFWYGAGLSALALLTGQGYYPIPAALCLGLFAGCKLREQRGADW